MEELTITRGNDIVIRLFLSAKIQEQEEEIGVDEIADLSVSVYHERYGLPASFFLEQNGFNRVDVTIDGTTLGNGPYVIAVSGRLNGRNVRAAEQFAFHVVEYTTDSEHTKDVNIVFNPSLTGEEKTKGRFEELADRVAGLEHITQENNPNGEIDTLKEVLTALSGLNEDMKLKDILQSLQAVYHPDDEELAFGHTDLIAPEEEEEENKEKEEEITQPVRVSRTII